MLPHRPYRHRPSRLSHCRARADSAGRLGAEAREYGAGGDERTEPNRAQAYYHLALASVYEDDAISDGRTDEVNKAIEEYKLALDADPNSRS